MTHLIHARITASISELKKAPMQTIEAAHGEPIAILNRNTPAFYCISVELYEQMLEQLEDIELNRIADARIHQKRIKVDINEL